MRPATFFWDEAIAAGVKEHPDGSNSGPEIDEWCDKLQFSHGIKWCGVFVSIGFRLSWEDLISDCGGRRQARDKAHADNLIQFPYRASSQEIKRFFESRNLLTYNADDLLNWESAVGGWSDANGNKGHVFGVEQRYTHDNHVLRVGTAEGNSNDAGHPNGNACVHNRRAVPVDGRHKLWFCNTSNCVGGKWWPIR